MNQTIAYLPGLSLVENKELDAGLRRVHYTLPQHRKKDH